MTRSESFSEALSDFTRSVEFTDSGLGDSAPTSSLTKRTDIFSASLSLHSPSCSRNDVTETDSINKQRDNIPQTLPNAETKNIATNVTNQRTLAKDTDTPINVIASIKATETPCVLNIAVNRKVNENTAKNKDSTSVVSGIATVSGASLDKRTPPPVPARVFTCITEDPIRKPKRKNCRPSPPQQRR